jgi:hypothetical protein
MNGGLTLCAIPMADRLNELRFDVPVAGGWDATSCGEHVDADRVARALRGQRATGLSQGLFKVELAGQGGRSATTVARARGVDGCDWAA